MKTASRGLHSNLFWKNNKLNGQKKESKRVELWFILSILSRLDNNTHIPDC